jgi:hypothetical protein
MYAAITLIEQTEFFLRWYFQTYFIIEYLWFFPTNPRGFMTILFFLRSLRRSSFVHIYGTAVIIEMKFDLECS